MSTLFSLAQQLEPITPEHHDNPDYHGRLKTAEAAMTYILAGNSHFTLVSKETGTRFTYRVSKAEKCLKHEQKDCQQCAATFFVGVLTGPENTTDYKYAGLYKLGEFRSAGKVKISVDAPSVKAFIWTMSRLSNHHLPDNLEVWHDGRCGRCGRKLTVPESVEAGLGPECAGRLQ